VQSCAYAQAPLKLTHYAQKNQACSRRTLSRAMPLGKARCSGSTQNSLGRAAQSLFVLQSFVTKKIYDTNLYTLLI
jgi:hypothetical protein